MCGMHSRYGNMEKIKLANKDLSSNEFIIQVSIMDKVLIYSRPNAIIQSIFKFKIFFNPKIHMKAQSPRITEAILRRAVLQITQA